MRGVMLSGNRTIEFIEVDDPVPGPGEVVVEIKASGFCGSDLYPYRDTGDHAADAPVIAGHEPAGVVVEVGPMVTDRAARVGDRVMVHHYWGCGACRHCRTGWPQMCTRQRPIVYGSGDGHGGHAPYMKVPAGTLVPLPDELSFVAGAAISCGTGTAYAALKRLRVTGGDTITIFGQGPLGLSATQLASAMGARVIAVDINADRLRLATRMGAAEVVDSSRVDTVEAVGELTRGEGTDLVLEASGATAARNAGLASLRPWGTMALVGVGGEFHPDLNHMCFKQATVFGSLTFSTIGQADCADFVVRSGIAVDDVFTDTWGLAEADEAYRMFDQQASGKGVFVFP